jgi:hypothetical protein
MLLAMRLSRQRLLISREDKATHTHGDSLEDRFHRRTRAAVRRTRAAVRQEECDGLAHLRSRDSGEE